MLCRLWERRNNRQVTPLEELTVQPPSTVAVLLHPKMLACVMCNLSGGALRAIARLTPTVSVDRPPRPNHTQRVVDSHVHIDTWGSRFHGELGSLEDCRLIHQYLICNYVFPSRWSHWDEAQRFPDAYASFGIHPNVCADHNVSDWIPELRRRLLSAKCVALGEVGVDYHYRTSSDRRRRQLTGLEAQLRLRPSGMPIVVHCRGKGALTACLEVFVRCLSPRTVIQVHCFLGGPREVERWSRAFPRTVFSFGHRSLALDGDEAVDHRLAARSLSLDRILVEYDAPYLQRSPTGCQETGGPPSPRMDLLLIGRWLGCQKGLCPSVVLEAARLNALRVFSLAGV